MRTLLARDQRFAYGMLICLVVILWAGAYADSMYGSGANQRYFLGAFVVLGASSLLLIGYTMRDRHEFKVHPPSLTVDKVEAGPQVDVAPVELVTIHKVPTPAVPIIAAMEPSTAARPTEIPRRIALEVMQIPYEDAFLAPSDMAKQRAEESVLGRATRLLCHECGECFVLYLNPERPAVASCPQCERKLRVMGPAKMGSHVSMRCRHCGEKSWMPQMPEATAHRCPTCGQRNEIRERPLITVTQRHR